MSKRMSIRIVEELAGNLNKIAKKRGLTINSLISEMAWSFVEDWEDKQKEKDKTSKCRGGAINERQRLL